MLRLYTFTVSHFSEKARWGLDALRVPYEEKVLLPGAHFAAVRRLAKKTTVPVLVHDGHAIQESSAILDYLERELGGTMLTPPDGAGQRARDLEARADHAFGLGIQRVMYGAFLGDRKAVTDLWTQRGPSWGRFFYGVSYPVVSRLVRRRYDARPDPIARAKARMIEALDEIDACLQKNEFLLGDRPCRLDIAVAALLAPMSRPKEHIVAWPAAFPEPLAPFVADYEQRPIHEHVLRMYREHRSPAKG